MSTLNFDALWRDRGVAKGLQGIGRDADVAGRKMSGLNASSSKLGGGFGKVAGGAAAVGVGLLAAAGAAVGYGLKIAASNEQAQISFTTMLGSGKKAEAFLKQLRDFAAKTPFEFPELQKAASSLIAVGVNARSVIPIMTTLGDVTSGMGTGAEGVQRATVALQQMQSAGRITAEDLNQLRDAGLPLKDVFKAISAETGTSVEKLAEMSRTGKLGRVELEALMKSLESGKGFERFNGLMDKQSKSLTGMLSTLKDTFGMGLADAIQPVLPFLKGAVGAVTKGLGDLFSWVATHQEDVVEGIVDTGNAVLGLAKTFVTLEASALNALAGIADGIATILEGMDKLALGDQFSGTVSALRGFSTGAREGAKSMNENLVPAIEDAHKKWNQFGADQRTKAALRDANQVIVRAVQGTDDALKKNGKTVDENTKKGQSNRSALQDLATAHKDYIRKLDSTEASTKDVSRATDKAREDFIKNAQKMGASRKEAEKLADKYGLVKTKTDAAAKATRGYDSDINNLNNKTIKLTAQYRATASKALVKMLENVPGSQASGIASAFGTGGPSRGASLNSMIGAPVAAPGGPMPAGGPTIGASNFKVDTPGLNRARSMGQAWDDVALAAIGPAARAANRAIGKLGQNALDGLLAASTPSGSVGSYSAGMAATIARLRAAGARSFTTYPGHHPSMAKARDVTPHNWKIANTARASSGVWYVIYQMKIASKNHGNVWRQYHPSNFRGDWQHRRHIHVGWYDRGGLTRDLHAAGQPERVLSPSNTRSFDNLVRVISANRGNVGGNTYIINATHYSDAQALQRALVDLDRQGRLAVVKR